MGCIVRVLLTVVMSAAGTIVWNICSVDKAMIARSKVISLSYVIIIRCVRYGHVMFLELMANERSPLERLLAL